MKQNKKNAMIGVVLYLVFFVVHLMLSTVSKYPVIWDEAGYIGFASKIATGNGYSFGYYGGYPLIISIAYWFSDNIHVVYRIIQVINAVISGFLPIVVFVLAGRMDKQLSPKIKILIAVLVSFYPHYLTASNSALPEALFAVVFVIFTILGIDLIKEDKFNIKKSIAILAIYIYLCFVHPRALALIFVLIGFFIFQWIKIKNIKITTKKWLIFGMIAVGILALFLLLVKALTISDNINIHHFSSMILSLFSISGIWSFIVALITQFGYLLMSTLGIVFFGIYYLVDQKKEEWKSNLFVLLSFVAVMALSAIFLYHAQRADHVLYGRYNEGALIPVFVAGIIFLYQKCEKRAHHILWMLSLAVALFTYFVRGDLINGIYLTTNNVNSLHIYHLFLTNFNILWAFCIFATIYALFYLVYRNNKKMGFIVLFIFLLGSAIYTNQGEYKPEINPRIAQNTIVSALGDYKEKKSGELSVNFQTSTDEINWHMMNYCMNFPNIKIEEFTDINQASFSDADVIITTDNQTIVPNAGIIAVERDLPITMWIKGEKSLDGLRHKGKLTPESYQSEIMPNYKNVYGLNERMNFDVSVTHKGSGMIWQGHNYARDIRDMVRLSLRIFNEQGEEVYATRFSLENNLKPRDSVTIDAYIEPWDLKYIRDTYGTGNYIMYLDMVQDFTAWFSNVGDKGTVKANLRFDQDAVHILDSVKESAPKEYNDFKIVRPYLLIDLSQKERELGYYTNNTINIKSNQVRAENAVIENIALNTDGADRIVLKTKGNNPFLGDIEKAKLTIKVNGENCEFIEFRDNAYYFSFPQDLTQITKIEIGSALYRPIEQTPVPIFLGYTDKSPKFYTFGLKVIKKLTGLDLDGRMYGIDIDKIYLK